MVSRDKFYIRSIAQPDLVLQAYDGGAVVGWIDPSFKDQAQQWWRFSDHTNQVLTNVGTGARLAVVSDAEGAQLKLGGEGTQWMFTGGDESCVVQPADSNTMVMNLLGPNFNLGSPVGLWRWSRGQSNELWRFDSVGIIEPYQTDEAYVLCSVTNMALRAADDGRVFVQEFSTSKIDDAMLWTLTYWTSGISLKNKKTGRWLAYGGSEAPLVMNGQMANQSVWTPSQYNVAWWNLGYWSDTNLAMRTFSADRPVNNDTVGTGPLRGESSGQTWNIQVRAGTGWKNFVPKPRDTKILG